ncbi:MAG TPA: hypothetical protein DCS43_11560 [Verrucomicrobia bacterium]|nr:hypothetical protein [Verrucomicrobiota bacterium]
MSSRERKAECISAFDLIVSCYQTLLIRYAVRITGCNDVAQDVVQDAFIRMFRKWEGVFEPSTELQSWLYRVTHNCAVDAVRHRARRAEIETQHAAEQPESIDPVIATGGSEAALRAAAALDTLTARDRQLVVLKVYEEKSYKEISDITGLSIGNVGYILHHAMRKMAHAIKTGGDV